MARARFALSPIIVAVASVVLLVGAGPPPPKASSSGCSGSATSQTADGGELGSVTVPGGTGTVDNPFLVTWDGPISWTGTTEAPIQNGTWSVRLEPAGGGLSGRLMGSGVSQLAKGTIENQEGKTTASGTDALSDYLSMQATTGLYRVSWDATGAGATCTGDVVINIQGNPWSTPAFYVALLFLLLGGFALVPLMTMLF
jgi:hypothetical protein